MITTKQAKKKHYQVVLFYPRANRPKFATKTEALNFVIARALTRRAAYYTEVWEMDNEDDGQMLFLFDYGCTKPEELVRK